MGQPTYPEASCDSLLAQPANQSSEMSSGRPISPLPLTALTLLTTFTLFYTSPSPTHRLSTTMSGRRGVRRKIRLREDGPSNTVHRPHKPHK